MPGLPLSSVATQSQGHGHSSQAMLKHFHLLIPQAFVQAFFPFRFGALFKSCLEGKEK
jgi:hypothetical protein